MNINSDLNPKANEFFPPPNLVIKEENKKEIWQKHMQKEEEIEKNIERINKWLIREIEEYENREEK